MSIEALHAAEVQVENVADLAQFIAAAGGSQPQQIVQVSGGSQPQQIVQVSGGSQPQQIVQVSDGATPIIQVQDAIANGTIIQVSDQGVAPLVQVTDQSQGIFITDSLNNPVQILDGSLPIIQTSDGNIIQLAQPFMPTGTSEGLTQVVQFANGQIALIEQQENIDPQAVQHLVFEQVPPQQMVQAVEEATQAQIETKPLPATVAVKQELIQPPVGKGPFKCETCEKEFPKWNQLQRHLKHHEEDKPHQCIHCPASFNILENLKLHEATHVEEGQRPQCPECSKKFSRIASLKAHIMLHEREESLMCPECGDEFSLQGQLDRHLKEHRDAELGQKTYNCRQCTQEFTKPALLKEHMKQHYKIKTSLSHKTYKKVVDRSGFGQKCPHCLKSFQKPSQLERHIRVHTGERPFKCSTCNKAFNQKGALQIHMTKHTGQRTHSCDFCSQMFAQKGNLRAHIQRVHTLSEEMTDTSIFHCDQCSCVFKKLGSLNAHISRFHTEHSPEDLPTQVGIKKQKESPTNKIGVDVIQQLLQLSEATGETGGQTDSQNAEETSNTPQKGLSESDILQQALVNSGLPGSEKKKGLVASTVQTMNIRDTATGVVKKHVIRKVAGVRWHQCTFCTKEFKKPSDLVRHIRIHSHEKPYKCNQCFRAFAVKSTLTAHIRTHTGIKHFKCNVCDKLFSTHGSLKVHTRLHTGARPFECPHCEKKFRTAAHKKSHVMQHFKDGEIVRDRVRERRRRVKPGIMGADVPLQEPILITDTGLIQQPPRNNLLNQYLGDSHSVDRPYKCTYCQRGFKKSSHLKQHVRSHTGEKPYKCNQCGRTFVSNGVLKSHIRIHTGVKHYKCMLCETLFTTNGSLKRHMSTHSEVRPFMCPYCQKTFKTSVNCKKHMKTHRHELAFQSTVEQDGIQLHPSQDPIQTLDHEETHPETEETTFVTEVTQNDLDLGQQDLNSSAIMSQQDLSQQSILSQANLQDALGLGTGGLELQQTLNHQLFGQQQTFNQSLLGTGQQNFQAINNQMNSLNQNQQYSIQTSGMNQIDINSITNTPFSGDPVGQDIQTLTNLTNVSVSQATEDDSAVQQINTVTEIPDTTIQNILQPQPLEQPADDGGNDDDDDDDDDDEIEDSGAPREHVIARDSSRKYHCEYCDKSYKKSSHLKQHIRSHTGERPYRCAVCCRNFVSVGVLRSHLRTHSGVKEFKCNVCGAMFTTNGSLTRHMNVHLSRREIACTICDERFKNDALLKRHMKHHHRQSEAMVQEAEMTLPSKYMHVPPGQINPGLPQDTALSEKILIESASEKDRISEVKELQIDQGERHANQCPQCVKSFKKPSDLVRHVRIHTGEKPFNCQVCNRKFTVKSTLDSHMKTHGGVDKTIKCHICASMFSTKGSLKVHMRLHTGAKPFRCPHCSQRFRTSGHRKSHILSHYKPEGTTTTTKKRKSQTAAAAQQEKINYLNNTDNTNNMNQQNEGQVINIDPALLQGSNILPLSLNVDNFGNIITDSGQATQIMQGTDGVQLQLTGVNLPQGVQIAGLDPSMFQQTVQIDANLLQQLQGGNMNITLNPNQMDGQGIAQTDPNMVQNIQLQQIQQIQDQINPPPNMVIQHPMMGQINLSQAPGQPAMPEMTPGSYVVAGEGTFVPEQQQQPLIGHPQVAPVEVLTPQQPQPQDISMTISTTIPDNTQHSEHSITDNITTGNTELATTASNIEQTVPNEMDTIDPNITQNIGNIENDIDEDADNEDAADSDLDDMADDGVNDKSGQVNSDEDFNDVVHESVGDDMPNDSMAQDGLDQMMQVQDTQATYVQLIVDNRQHHCPVCGKSFKRSGHLKEHIQIHDGNQRGDKPTPHKCSHCEKSFQKPSQLERHLRIHTGERPFRCELCDKSFNQKNALQIHLKKHSGDKPHKCEYCDNAFTQKGNLKTHIKRAHHIDMVQSMKIVPKSEKGATAAERGGSESQQTEVKKQDVIMNLEGLSDVF